MEFRILINILLRRKYLFIIVLATTIIVAIIGSSIITPVYEAISRVKVESKDDIRKRLGRSTDDGDAVMMAFANIETHSPRDMVEFV